MPLTAISHIFAGNPLNRASERRGDRSWLLAQAEDSSSLAVALWQGRPLIEMGPSGTPQLAYLPAPMALELAGGLDMLLFLGLWNGTAVFALDMPGSADPASGALLGLGRFEELRGLAMALPGGEAGICATAKAMFEWDRRHRHCAACGQPSRPADGGWKRICPACEAQHFPRTDPVVIMLATKGERCLLGRQPQFPKGMFSALAGFVEPGESIEEACARELVEEAGLRAIAVRYHSTQPWPYPSSLMIGLLAGVENDDARPDQTELEEVRWFSRSETRDLIAGTLKGVWAPPPMAIAHQLIKSWAFQDT